MVAEIGMPGGFEIQEYAKITPFHESDYSLGSLLLSITTNFADGALLRGR